MSYKDIEILWLSKNIFSSSLSSVGKFSFFTTIVKTVRINICIINRMYHKYGLVHNITLFFPLSSNLSLSYVLSGGGGGGGGGEGSGVIP
jgi:hypothetical protein